MASKSIVGNVHTSRRNGNISAWLCVHHATAHIAEADDRSCKWPCIRWGYGNPSELWSRHRKSKCSICLTRSEERHNGRPRKWVCTMHLHAQFRRRTRACTLFLSTESLSAPCWPSLWCSSWSVMFTRIGSFLWWMCTNRRFSPFQLFLG